MRTFLIAFLCFSLLLPPAIAAPPSPVCLANMDAIAQAQAKVNQPGQAVAEVPAGPVKAPGSDMLAKQEGQWAITSLPHDFLVHHYREIRGDEALSHVPMTGAIIIGSFLLYRMLGGHKKGETAAPHQTNGKKLLDSEIFESHQAVLETYEQALKQYERALVEAPEEAFKEWEKTVRKVGGAGELLDPRTYVANAARALAYVRYIKKLRAAHGAKKIGPEEAEELAVRKMNDAEFEAWAVGQTDNDKVNRLAEVRREKGPVVEEPVPDIAVARTALEAEIKKLQEAEKAVYARAKELGVMIGDPKDPFADNENPTNGGYANHPRYYLQSNQMLKKAIEQYIEGWRKWAEGPADNTWEYYPLGYAPWKWPHRVVFNLGIAVGNTFKHLRAMLPGDLPPWIPGAGERGLLGWNYAGRPTANLVRSLWSVVAESKYFFGVKGGAITGAAAMAAFVFWMSEERQKADTELQTTHGTNAGKRMDAETAMRLEDTSAGEMLFTMVHMWTMMKREFPDDFPNFPFDFNNDEQRAHLRKLYDAAIEEELRVRDKDPATYATDKVFKVEVARRFWREALLLAQKDLGLKLDDEALFGENKDGLGGLTDNFATAYPEAVKVSALTLQRFESNLDNLQKLLEGKDFRKEFEEILKKQEELTAEGKIDPAFQLTPYDFEQLKEFLRVKAAAEKKAEEKEDGEEENDDN
ncbi:MAG: hypothetical protein H6617_09865 [Bdellovibrionaceae bacterium]|nr:hypothetical protein [Pseudobdellovibrionaceae bacterium]